jgi:transposase-like protein
VTVGVYGIFDKRDNTCLYVGLSRDIAGRWKKHLSRLRAGKHGRPEFNDFFASINNDESLLEFKVLEECASVDKILNLCEMKWFILLQPKFYGPRPSENNKWTHSKETRAKISAAAKKARIFDYSCKYCLTDFSSSDLNRVHCSAECARLSSRRIESDESMKEKLIDMYSVKKMTLMKIGDELNVSHVTIYSLLEKFGIPRRGRSKAGIVNEYVPVFTFLDNSNTKAKAAKVAAHNRWHKSRGIISYTCEICKVENSETA